MRWTKAGQALALSRQVVATAVMLSLGAVASTAHAAIVPVLNASFEDPTTAQFTSGTITNWTLSSPTQQGVFRPSAFGPAGIGATDPTALDQTAFLNSGFISQTLPSVLTVNTQYTLRVDVGDRADLPFPGYAVQLFAGSTLLSQDSSLVPVSGWLTSTVTFTALPGNPNLGQNLEIRLVNTGGFPQVNFDNVRLDAVGITAPAVPLPASAAIWGLGALGLGLGFRRRKTVAT